MAACRRLERRVVANIVQGLDKLGSWLPTSGAQAGWYGWGKRESRQSTGFDACTSTANDVRARSGWLSRESTWCGVLDACDKTVKFCTRCCGQ